jgi:hypothetical protein
MMSVMVMMGWWCSDNGMDFLKVNGILCRMSSHST